MTPVNAAQPDFERPSEGERDPKNANIRRKFWLAGVLFLTFAAYAPSLRFDFVHDDRGQIVENPAVKSWRYLPQYFKRQVWAGVYPHDPGNYYRPGFLLWLRLNDIIFGLHPWGWHLTTILLHLIATLLVYFLARRVLLEDFAAVVAALIFGLHPVHIEAVAWISGVTEPLSAIFFIFAFLCHLKRRESQGRKGAWLALALLFYAVAMLEKETVLVLPLLIIAFEWIYTENHVGERRWRWLANRGMAALKPALPFLALVVPYLGIRVMALEGFSHPMTPMPLATVLVTVPSLIGFWIQHMICPVGLSTFYSYSAVENPSIENFTLPAMALMLVLLLGAVAARKSRSSGLALMWIILPLVPLLDIQVFAKNDFAHDRYLYLPSVGFAILAALAFERMPATRNVVWGIPASRVGALLGLATLMAFGIVRESSYFRNNKSFYEHCWRTAPESTLAQINFAAELGESGRYPEALKLLNQLVTSEPANWNVVYNLGLTYYRLGRLEEAGDYFLRAIRLQPEAASAHMYLGLVELRMGRLTVAEASVRRAIELDAQGYGYHFALAMILKERGDPTAALTELRTELANYPQENAAQQQVAEIEASTRY